MIDNNLSMRYNKQNHTRGEGQKECGVYDGLFFVGI